MSMLLQGGGRVWGFAFPPQNSPKPQISAAEFLQGRGVWGSGNWNSWVLFTSSASWGCLFCSWLPPSQPERDKTKTFWGVCPQTGTNLLWGFLGFDRSVELLEEQWGVPQCGSSVLIYVEFILWRWFGWFGAWGYHNYQNVLSGAAFKPVDLEPPTSKNICPKKFFPMLIQVSLESRGEGSSNGYRNSRLDHFLTNCSWWLCSKVQGVFLHFWFSKCA